MPTTSVTQILGQIESGDPAAAEQLLPLIYDELRKLAAQRLAGDATAEALTIIDIQAKKPLFTLHSERSPIKSVSWSPDGNRIAVGLSDGGVSIWDMESVKIQLTEIGLGWK